MSHHRERYDGFATLTNGSRGETLRPRGDVCTTSAGRPRALGAAHLCCQKAR
jgi:hypothetical protein